MKNHIHAIVSVCLFVAICGLYYQLAMSHPIAYIWASYEDLLGEWAQFFLFSMALIFSCRQAILTAQFRLFFGVLSVACFYVIMEEISWGQRLFGWGTSAFFKEHNLQGETNLHNMLTGPYRTFIKDFLEYGLALGLTGFGLLYPIALKYQWTPAVWLNKRGVPGSPLYLAPLFVAAGFLELGPLSFNEAEIAEVFVGLALALMALHYYHASQLQISYQEQPQWTVPQSLGLTCRIVNLVFISVLLAVATTFAIYATDAGQHRADRRISNGIEKFSGRYKNYENWDMVIVLNKILLKASPSDRRVLRNLGEAYQNLNDPESANVYLDRAINKDLRVLRKEPWRASVNRSLVRTYRLKGDTVNAEKYLEQALSIGIKRMQEHPSSANAMYSLAETYVLMGDREKANPLFIKAYQLKPQSKSFRKQYYRSIK